MSYFSNHWDILPPRLESLILDGSEIPEDHAAVVGPGFSFPRAQPSSPSLSNMRQALYCISVHVCEHACVYVSGLHCIQCVCAADL